MKRIEGCLTWKNPKLLRRSDRLLNTDEDRRLFLELFDEADQAEELALKAAFLWRMVRKRFSAGCVRMLRA